MVLSYKKNWKHEIQNAISYLLLVTLQNKFENQLHVVWHKPTVRQPPDLNFDGII